MYKYILSFGFGIIVATSSILGVQWFGIESARKEIDNRVYQRCFDSLVKRSGCLQKRGQNHCAEMVLDECGANPALN